MLLLEIRKEKRFYHLKERFGFITALATQMKLCGMTLDSSQQAKFEEESVVSDTPSSQPCFMFSVERIHGRDMLLASHTNDQMESKSITSGVVGGSSGVIESSSGVIEDSSDMNDQTATNDRMSLSGQSHISDQTTPNDSVSVHQSSTDQSVINTPFSTSSKPRQLRINEDVIEEVDSSGSIVFHRIPLPDLIRIIADVESLCQISLQYRKGSFIYTLTYHTDQVFISCDLFPSVSSCWQPSSGFN